MKTNSFFIILAVFLLVIGCKSTQRLAVTERVTHDTLYLTNLRYDSVFIQNDHTEEYRVGIRPTASTPTSYLLTPNSTDTLFIRDTHVEHRYHLLHDTLKVIKLDSIPYEVQVVKTRVEKYTPLVCQGSRFCRLPLARVLYRANLLETQVITKH